MTKGALEQHQVWLYLIALLQGSGLSWQFASDAFIQELERGIWLTLGILLYATFCQVPLMHLRQAFRHRRFMAALLLPVAEWCISGSLQFGRAVQSLAVPIFQQF